MLIDTFLMWAAADDDSGNNLTIVTASYTDTQTEPTDAIVLLWFNGADGGSGGLEGQVSVQTGGLNPEIPQYDWVVPASAAGDYYVRATLQSGFVPTTGTLGVWLPLTVTQQWIVEQPFVGTYPSELLFELSKDQSTVLESGTITLTATVNL